MNHQNSGSLSSTQAPSSIPRATSPNAVRYPMNKKTNFFLCRHCRNHISCWTDGIQRVHGAKGKAIICRDAINVNTDPRSSGWYFNDLPVVFFHCKGCRKTLGERLLDRDRLVHGIREGNYLLYPNQTLYWNGSQLRYAHTNQPVEDDKTP